LDAASTVAVQADGKIVAAGGTTLTRWTSNGSLDTTFGSAGVVVQEGGWNIGSLVLQPDGKIVVAGGSPYPSDFTLTRYNSDGSLDATFGSAGKVSTDFSGGFEGANDVALQSDGRNRCSRTNGSSFQLRTGAATTVMVRSIRHSVPVGKLSPIFQAMMTLCMRWHSGPDGKIVDGGLVGNAVEDEIRLARYNSDGTLDTTFGTGGKAFSWVSRRRGHSAPARWKAHRLFNPLRF
jgi:uncharacterized delta-60 repeat protein